ncbi:MAG: NTP transferase domain-containing protein [Paraglaciecola sp.]|uniref:NTP transferase domain-containing protein n=1 Tax=Paraglaciecola sp. TaxID=1920173 RepID=UPI00329931F0
MDQNRDKCESLLLQHAIDTDLPVLGVCRGMQFISHYFGSTLLPCEGHVTESLKIKHQSALILAIMWHPERDIQFKKLISKYFVNFFIGRIVLHKGLILAAGRGSRMGSLTDNAPKCYTTIDGKRLIEWQLNAMNTSYIDEVDIITGYRKDNFEYPTQYFHNEIWDTSNMARSLTKAHTWLEKHDCIISYSDIIYPPRSD